MAVAEAKAKIIEQTQLVRAQSEAHHIELKKKRDEAREARAEGRG